jgi:hypothetical protein
MIGFARFGEWNKHRRGLHLPTCELFLSFAPHFTKWTSFFTSELVEASTIKVIIKTGHTVAGVPIRKLEASVEFNIKEAMEAFWKSEYSISRTLKPQSIPSR